MTALLAVTSGFTFPPEAIKHALDESKKKVAQQPAQQPQSQPQQQ